MADPLKLQNLVGTLVLASSGSTASGVADATELNLPVSTTISNGSSKTTADVRISGQEVNAIFLVKLSSGEAVITADRTTDGTTPTFASANKVQQTVTTGQRVYLPLTTEKSTVTYTNGVSTVTKKQNVVALKIQNNAGATLTVEELRLLVLAQLGSKNISHNSKTALREAAAGDVDDSSGKFSLNT